MEYKKIFQSKEFHWVFIGLGAFMLLLIAFLAGEVVGFRKARFSYGWGEQSYRNLTGPRRGLPENIRNQDFLDSHGAIGSVLTVSSSSLVLADHDGTERTILFDQATSVRRFRDAIAAGDLKTGDTVAVVGSPDDRGNIQAKLIRVLPPLPGFPSSTPTSTPNPEP